MYKPPTPCRDYNRDPTLIRGLHPGLGGGVNMANPKAAGQLPAQNVASKAHASETIIRPPERYCWIEWVE